ncbi:MAG: hypothetical protein IIV02_06725, partial [Peptococcaceae bacterium]|nr:hypothetical protein [Peptococcaceae bacterium]
IWKMRFLLWKKHVNKKGAEVVKVKVSKEWLEKRVFKHEFNGEIWKQVIEDHNYIGEYMYDINIKEGGKYGVRVGFFDDRLPHKKLFISPVEGSYEIIEEAMV